MRVPLPRIPQVYIYHLKNCDASTSKKSLFPPLVTQIYNFFLCPQSLVLIHKKAPIPCNLYPGYFNTPYLRTSLNLVVPTSPSNAGV